MPTPQFLTVREVATILRKNKKTIYRWLDEGFLDYLKVRDGYLIRTVDVQKLLKKTGQEGGYG